MTNYTTQVAVPQSFITKGKQRLKQYVDTIYLNNGDQFEIELFNPTQNKVLAKIELNGNSIGSGIILRPGERVFLERYLDVAKKFLFETYEVNGTKQEIKNAIANNGDVVIKFYSESIPNNFYYNYNYPIQTTQQYPWWNHGSTSNIGMGGTGTLTTNALNTSFTIPNGNTSYTTTSLNNSSASLNNSSTSFVGASMDMLSSETQSSDILRSSVKKSKKLLSTETGRVEKGSSSNQTFTYDSSSFNSWYTWVNTWKILPVSQKQLVKEDLVVYCVNCGSKKKKDSHNFCPTCGTKF